MQQRDYPFYYTPNSVKIEVGDVWVNRFHPNRTALITKEIHGGWNNGDIEVIYFGGHHPEKGDKVTIPRHVFRSHYKPFNTNQ